MTHESLILTDTRMEEFHSWLIGFGVRWQKIWEEAVWSARRMGATTEPLVHGSQLLVYVNISGHPRLGQIGQFTYDHWSAGGDMSVRFADGVEKFRDSQLENADGLRVPEGLVRIPKAILIREDRDYLARFQPSVKQFLGGRVEV